MPKASKSGVGISSDDSSSRNGDEPMKLSRITLAALSILAVVATASFADINSDLTEAALSGDPAQVKS